MRRWLRGLPRAYKELQIWVTRTRDIDQRRTEIEANSFGGLKRRQRIPDTAADFEHARTLRNQKAQIAVVLAVKKRGLLKPFRTRGGILFRVREYLGFAGQRWRSHDNNIVSGKWYFCGAVLARKCPATKGENRVAAA